MRRGPNAFNHFISWGILNRKVTPWSKALGNTTNYNVLIMNMRCLVSSDRQSTSILDCNALTLIDCVGDVLVLLSIRSFNPGLFILIMYSS